MKSKIRLIMTAVLVGMMITIGGCSAKKNSEMVLPTIEGYSKTVYETFEVQQGDIHPLLEIKLTAEDYNRQSYYPKYDGMKVSSVNVNVGDRVSAGDILVVFDVGDIDKELEQYQNQITEDQLLIDHYTKLAEIDSEADYSDDINALKKDIGVAQLYVQELNAKLDAYTIKAEASGSVAIISDILKNIAASDSSELTLGTSNNLITLNYGTGTYTGETDDDYKFEIGKTYKATFGVAEYPMELVNIEESGNSKILTFKGNDEKIDYSSRDKVNLIIEKESLNNVIFVAESCVFAVDEKTYVYVVDSDGFREGREVSVGATVDGFTVIESGLEAGEKVMLR